MIPREILARVPGGEGGAVPLAVQPLGQGTLNRAFLVTSRAGRFVVRLDRPAGEIPGVDRERERLLHACAAQAGLAPRLHATGLGFTVTEYVEGRAFVPGDFTAASSAAALAEALARLHALAVPCLPVFDLAAVARDYAARIEAQEPAAAPAITRELEALDREVACSKPAARAPAIVHMDLHHTNVIVSRSAVLLDWEFAQVGDPLLDLACWLAYYPAAAPQADELLARTSLAGAASGEMLASLASAFARLTVLWHRALGPRAGGIRRSSAD